MPRGEGGGRPRVEQDKLDKFLDFIKQGNGIRASVGSAGISHAVFYKLMRIGHAERNAGRKTRLAKFVDKFEEARAIAETDLVKIVRDKSPEDVASARFMLAHINPKRWADRTRIDVHGEPPIDRADLLRGVQELAKAVRDEVEDPAVMARIDARWADVIEGWLGKTPARSKRRAGLDELDEVIVDGTKALTAGSDETDQAATG